MINRKFILILSFLTAQPLVFAKNFMTLEKKAAIEKKFVRAFNSFKNLSTDYPTALQAEVAMREIINGLFNFGIPLEEYYVRDNTSLEPIKPIIGIKDRSSDEMHKINEVLIHYIDKHRAILKENVRLSLLLTILRKDRRLLKEADISDTLKKYLVENVDPLSDVSGPESSSEKNSKIDNVKIGDPLSDASGPESSSEKNSKIDNVKIGDPLSDVSGPESSSESQNFSEESGNDSLSKIAFPKSSSEGQDFFEESDNVKNKNSSGDVFAKNTKSRIKKNSNADTNFKIDRFLNLSSPSKDNNLSKEIDDSENNGDDSGQSYDSKKTQRKKLTKEERLKRQLG